MNRKQFIQSHGATCRNWNWSWAFVNEKERFVIFGAWDNLSKDNVSLILSEDWKKSDKKRGLPGYPEAREYMKLIQNNDYQLKTFPLIHSDANKDEFGKGPSKIGGFEPTLTDKSLFYAKGEWYALDESIDNPIPNELPEAETLLEGASKQITVNAYERNGKARVICINHYGYQCAVCNFDFAKVYGSIGEKYIHVHHITPISKMKKEYELNPIKDLIPVCPNCHAMIHRTLDPLTIDDLKDIIIQQRNAN